MKSAACVAIHCSEHTYLLLICFGDGVDRLKGRRVNRVFSETTF